MFSWTAFFCSAVEAFSKSFFKLAISWGMVTISFLMRGNADALNIGAGGLRGDDLDASGPGAGIGFVALIVVPVKMRVDYVFDGLGREFFDLFDEGAGGGRFGVRVDDEDAIAEDDDGGVAIYSVGGLGDGGVDTVGDGLYVEEIFAGGGGGGDAGGGKQEDEE